MDQCGIVETRMDHNIGNVELLVLQRLGRGAHVVLTQPDLEDGAHRLDKGEAVKSQRITFQIQQPLSNLCNY